MFEEAAELADAFAASGVDLAFGVTGSGASLAFIHRLEQSGARYLGASHEGAAAIMAGAASADSARGAVSVSIRGPGFANMLPGVLFNAFEGNPALSVSEAIAPDVPWSRRHKRVDQPALGRPVAKAYVDLPAARERAGDLVAFARREVRGPVHVDLCANPGLAAPDLGPTPLADGLPPAVEEALRRAERPALVVGSLARRRGWGSTLSALAIPVFTTAAAKGALDERSPFSAGVLTGAGIGVAPEGRVLLEADLVVGLGLRAREVLEAGPPRTRWLIVDEAGAGESEGFEGHVAAGISDAGCAALLDRLRRFSWGEETVREARCAARDALVTAAHSPSHVFEALNALDFAYLQVADTGAFCTLAEHLWQSGPERPFRGSPIARWMGAAVPQAIGFAAREPGRRVVCVVGDGGMMFAPEIRLAVAERLPICFLLLTDGGYGSVVAAADPARISARAVTVPRPSWWRAVEAMGCEAAPVASADALAAALSTWDAAGPLFLEMAFEPEAYRSVAPRIRR